MYRFWFVRLVLFDIVSSNRRTCPPPYAARIRRRLYPLDADDRLIGASRTPGDDAVQFEPPSVDSYAATFPSPFDSVRKYKIKRSPGSLTKHG